MSRRSVATATCTQPPPFSQRQHHQKLLLLLQQTLLVGSKPLWSQGSIELKKEESTVDTLSTRDAQKAGSILFFFRQQEQHNELK